MVTFRIWPHGTVTRSAVEAGEMNEYQSEETYVQR